MPSRGARHSRQGAADPPSPAAAAAAAGHQDGLYGRAADTDVVLASAQAYVKALNRLLAQRKDLAPRLHPHLSLQGRGV